jgi:ketosteroid isomerase-like protein
VSTAWERTDGITALDAATVEALERHWEDGWNGEDVDVIVEPFAADIVFSSPFVSRLTGDPSITTIEGYDAVRRYVADSFVRASPGIRYTLDASHAGTDSVVLVYTVHRPDGTDKPGADLMRLDGDGKVVEWRCHYPFAG